MPQKFSLGRIVATPGAIHALTESGEAPLQFLARHANGDWGDLESADKDANEKAIEHEDDPDRRDRILSSYRTRTGEKIFIITEHDRSATTLMLSDEY